MSCPKLQYRGNNIDKRNKDIVHGTSISLKKEMIYCYNTKALKSNLAFPCCIRQTQCLHQVLPSGAPSFLLADILKEFLPLMDKDLEVTFVMLVLIGGL